MTRRLLTALLAATALAGATASSAHAALTAKSSSCTAPVTGGAQVFSFIGDPRYYVLAPNGNFESGTGGWTLTGGAAVVGTTTGAGVGVHALYLPNGATAVSPAICIGSGNPVFRLFSLQSKLLSSVQAELIWTDSLGFSHTAPVGVDAATATWTPSPLMLLSAAVPLLPGDVTPVRLKFTGGLGGVLVDNVFLDPFRSR